MQTALKTCAKSSVKINYVISRTKLKKAAFCLVVQFFVYAQGLDYVLKPYFS